MEQMQMVPLIFLRCDSFVPYSWNYLLFLDDSISINLLILTTLMIKALQSKLENHLFKVYSLHKYEFHLSYGSSNELTVSFSAQLVQSIQLVVFIVKIDFRWNHAII